MYQGDGVCPCSILEVSKSVWYEFLFHSSRYGNETEYPTAGEDGSRNVKYVDNSPDFDPESHDKPLQSHDQEGGAEGGGATGGSEDAQDQLVSNLREVQ